MTAPKKGLIAARGKPKKDAMLEEGMRRPDATPTKALSILLPAEQAHELRKHAAEIKKPMSWVIEWALADYLKRKGAA